MCPVVFQGHMWNVKVTKDKKIDFTQTEHFQIVPQVWIHQWLWNVLQTLTWRGGLLFFEVFHQISRGQEINDFKPIWVRLLGRSQLSNPLHSSCYILFESCKCVSRYVINVVLQIVIRILGRILCVSCGRASLPEGTDGGDIGYRSGTMTSTWKTMAHVLDRLFFLVYCLTFSVMAIVFTCI